MDRFAFAVVSLLLVSCSRRSEISRAEVPLAPGEDGSATGFAVVELFTSEGCSSCPSADENLARIAKAAERDGRPVYALSFHVDYWNHLGWRDPFSSEDFSLRQRYYAKALGSGVYTPQMVVNGRAELTGSNQSGADVAIQDALSRGAPARITLRVSQEPNRLTVGYHVEDAPDAGVLTLCLVQSSGEVKVRAGENGGRTLSHRNVVRAYETRLVARSGDGEWKPTLASDIDPGRARVVVYVQHSESLGIVGAASARL